MGYFDVDNIPETSVHPYTPFGGLVEPDLLDGVIFRVTSDSDYEVDRLRNQIDGMKYYMELINDGDSNITVTWDGDYRATDLGYISPVVLNPDEVNFFEIICRNSLMFVVGQTGYVSDNYLRNPEDGSILINPETGLPLINPGA